jgi:hypothetical protein
MAFEESDELPYRGKELGGAFAAVSSGFRPSFFRYLYYDSNLRFATGSALVLLLVTGLAGFGGYACFVRGGWLLIALGIVLAGLAFLTGLIGLVFVIMALGLYYKNADVYESALLSPGIVSSRDPLVVMVLASMGNGSGAEYYGISRMDLARLPVHSHEPGTRVPCVCGFAAGSVPDRWGAFETDFISYGTGDATKIQECFRRLGNEPFERLEGFLKSGPLPENANQIILLDGAMQYLETIDKKAAIAAASKGPEEPTTSET